MNARWVLSLIVQVVLVAAGLTAETARQTVLAGELLGAAKEVVGRWQAAPDLIYEFNADGKFRILRDPSKQPDKISDKEQRWPLPANTVSCVLEGDFIGRDPKISSTPVINLRWLQQTIEQRATDGTLQRTTEKFPPSTFGPALYFLGKTDKPKPKITITNSEPVPDSELALYADAMLGDLLIDALKRKKESQMNERDWGRVGD